ncbi:DUF4442 domain-containing protein [Vibrio gallicus]|uniref:DUF4442 domain-containing protein n=1 Tax=Vibrio gallicus TaxID=190897 RepID=UPI0021C34638|nr:DUF4442 domain-containing protein [Vibrio gallicus]
MLSVRQKANLYLKLFSFNKVPMLWLCRPKIIRIDDDMVEVKVPLRRRTKNHLDSMYIGALVAGADVAGGFLAAMKAQNQGQPISLAFKGIKADFIKRPQSDVHFICTEGASIDDMLNETISTGQRVNRDVTIVATCPKLEGDAPVAEFKLTLSLKAK